ncbi:MAG: aspartate carbamoyltransferase catalytic subunit [Pseudobdellovibrionaceae bacterium]
MFQAGQSLLKLQHLRAQEIISFFEFVSDLEGNKNIFEPSGETAALLFFEPSTRTRMSFQTAAGRLGVQPLVISGKQGTSGEKGETDEDTVKNVAAMDPSVLVIRCQDDLDLEDLSKKVSMPIINAGWGKKGHPTQALLDAYTIWKKSKRNLEGVRLLMIGDVLHSRIAFSHFEFLQKLGVSIGICGPSEFIPEPAWCADHRIECFENLDEALKWSDAVMALRVQFERHKDKMKISQEQFHKQYGLTVEKIRNQKSNLLIMHPGPINYGIEMAEGVMKDARNCVLEQVRNGVFIRTGILHLLLGRRKK